MAEETWVDVFRSWHDAAVQQARKVTEVLAAIDRDEPKTPVTQALNEINTELGLHRMCLEAIRVGIECGVLPADSHN
jgi:hypothetical protein